MTDIVHATFPALELRVPDTSRTDRRRDRRPVG